MGIKYSHLTLEERCRLRGLMEMGLGVGEIVIEEWRRHYNTIRLLNALGRKPPTPETIVTMDQMPIMH